MKSVSAVQRPEQGPPTLSLGAHLRGKNTHRGNWKWAPAKFIVTSISRPGKNFQLIPCGSQCCDACARHGLFSSGSAQHSFPLLWSMVGPSALCPGYPPGKSPLAAQAGDSCCLRKLKILTVKYSRKYVTVEDK